MTLLSANALTILGRLEPSDLAAAPSELVALVGPNGGGKTSLLRALAGVDGASGGVTGVTIDGEALAQALPARRTRLVGLLPASRDIHWPIAVCDLLALGVEKAASPPGAEIVERLELGALFDRRVDRLSTGERTRVLIARLLAARPRLLLLDEPLSNLDPYWVRAVLTLVGERIRAERSAALLSVHDLGLLWRFDRVVAVAGGRIEFDGPPLEFQRGEAFERLFRLPFAAAVA